MKPWMVEFAKAFAGLLGALLAAVCFGLLVGYIIDGIKAWCGGGS